MTSFRFLSRLEIAKALSMAEAIQCMKDIFAQVSLGQTVMPARQHLAITEHQSNVLFMPAYLPQGGHLGLKLITLCDRNPAQGLPRIQAVVVLFAAATGRPRALLDGTFLTALRTGAASGAATDLLARPDSSVVAILGAGVQARTQLEAVCAVRQIRHVRVFDPSRAYAQAFADQMQPALGVAGVAADMDVSEYRHHGLEARATRFSQPEASPGKQVTPVAVQVAASAAEAVSGADIVCAATTSPTPAFADADLAAGVHINAIGSYQPSVQEVPTETVLRARVVVDHRESALAETGDLLIPIGQGLYSPDRIHAELGEIIIGLRPGRQSPQEVTLFKSVGLAVQDVAAAAQAVANAERLGLGTVVEL
ncbi:MAG: ornithine cyclodeaminase family protein [Tepidisphaerales bacterium]